MARKDEILFRAFLGTFGPALQAAEERKRREEEQARKDTQEETVRQALEAQRVKNAAIIKRIQSLSESQDPNRQGVEGLGSLGDIEGLTVEELQSATKLAESLYPDQEAGTEPKVFNLQVGDQVIPHTYDTESATFVPVKTEGGKVGGPKFAPSQRSGQEKQAADLASKRLGNLTKAYNANVNAIYSRVKLYLQPEDRQRIDNTLAEGDPELNALLGAMLSESVQKAGLPPEAKAQLIEQINGVNNTFLPLINAQVGVLTDFNKQEKPQTQERSVKGEKIDLPPAEIPENPDRTERRPLPPRPSESNEGRIVGNKFVSNTGEQYEIVNGFVTIDGVKYRVVE